MKKAEENRAQRILLIGSSAAGKTSLCQSILNQPLQYQKTQTVTLLDGTFIDTPGEFLDSPQFRGALSIAAADANLIVLVQDATEKETMFWPSYTTMFPKPVVGIVTKSDMATEKQIALAKKYLIMAGARKLFVVSSTERTGLDAFLEYIGYPETQEKNE